MVGSFACFGFAMALCGKQMCQCSKHRICPRGIGQNVCVSAVAGIGGLSNGAKRNAKADQLRPVPRHNVNKENESNEDTEPGSVK